MAASPSTRKRRRGKQRREDVVNRYVKRKLKLHHFSHKGMWIERSTRMTADRVFLYHEISRGDTGQHWADSYWANREGEDKTKEWLIRFADRGAYPGEVMWAKNAAEIHAILIVWEFTK